MASDSGITTQGERKKIYVWGEIDGIVRDEGKGGDLITLLDGSVWKVALILESAQNEAGVTKWCSAMITRQDVT